MVSKILIISRCSTSFLITFFTAPAVGANSFSDPNASRDVRGVDDEAYFMDNVEEGLEEMEERQSGTSAEAKRINKLWKEANPIAWTIDRL